MMLPSLQDTVSEASETISDVGRMDTLACFCILESKTSLSSFLPFFLFSADPAVYERIIHTISMGKSCLHWIIDSFCQVSFQPMHIGKNNMSDKYA